MRADFNWQLREGRDDDGDKFRHMLLVHGSGRILAKVNMPCISDGYVFSVAFYVNAGGKDLKSAYDHKFIDLESAMTFAAYAVREFGYPRIKKQKPVVDAASAAIQESKPTIER